MEPQHSRTIWLWRSDEENWERYSDDHNAQIEYARELGNQGVVLERNETTYFLDLSRLTQTNGRSGRLRRIFPIKLGSFWQVESSNGKGLQPFFSSEETREIEKALFERQEGFVLPRCTRTYYVDFLKLTLTDFISGKTRNIRVSEDEEGTRPCSTTVHVAADKDEVGKESFEADDTETETSVSESSTDSARFSVVHKHERRSSRPGTWRWANDSDSWSTFDNEIAAAIERSWESGAPEMMFERDSTLYFVDLHSLTQVNVTTGFTRSIQRFELGKKA